MDTKRLNHILDLFPEKKVLVFGDFFLDQYLVIDDALREVSLETGLSAHQVVGIRNSPGAAGGRPRLRLKKGLDRNRNRYFSPARMSRDWYAYLYKTYGDGF